MVSAARRLLAAVLTIPGPALLVGSGVAFAVAIAIALNGGSL